MRQRKVINDDDWTGWLQWMRNCFKYGTIFSILSSILPKVFSCSDFLSTYFNASDAIPALTPSDWSKTRP